MNYNLTICNNDPIKEGQLTTNDIEANIEAYNNIPIIQNPDDYYCSIIRFQIPALTLPLVNVLIQTPVTDVNKTIYSFTITQGTTTGAQAFVEWLPQVVLPPSQVPVVSTPPATQQAISEYYLCYDYTWFINLWNVALKQACSSFIGITQYPFFAYDATTQLISLYTPASFKQNDSSMTPYKIWINNSFLTYFVGMEKVNQNQNNINNPQGLDNYLVVRDNLVNDVLLNSISYLKTTFQYSAYGYWNFLKSIIITTTMNVNSEIIYNNNNSAYQNVQYINILEDYYPDLALQQGAGVQSQIFTYNAPSLYRIFTFNQKTPLYKVNLAINVVDTYGNIFPLLIPKGQLANFKLMFIRKDIYVGRGRHY